MQTEEFYEEDDFLATQLEPIDFPLSPNSGKVLKNNLSYISLNQEQPPFSLGSNFLNGEKIGENIPMMSPPITPRNPLQNKEHFAPNLSPTMPTFSNDLQKNPLQFHLSPPLTNSSPETQYGDLYHNQVKQYEAYHERPLFNFVSLPPSEQADVYNSHARYPAQDYNLSMKQAGSNASINSWVSGIEPSSGFGGSFQQEEWPLQQMIDGGYTCAFPDCNKSFAKQPSLKSHTRIHHSERNYTCDDCAASFRRSHDLKRHQRSLHSDVKPFGCSSCGKRFSRMDALKRHSSRASSPCYQPL